MGFLEDLAKKAEEAKEGIKNAVEYVKGDVEKAKDAIKNSPLQTDFNPFDDGKFNVGIGNDKSPINIGITGEGRFEDTPKGQPTEPRFGVRAKARVGDYGATGQFGSNPDEPASKKRDIDVGIVYPDPVSKERTEVGVGKGMVGVVKDLLTGGKPTALDAESEDGIVKRTQRKKGIIVDEKGVVTKVNRGGGFTVPKGALGANKGIYAAVLNGEEGFLDKSTGKFTSYDNLTPEQKARIASDFVDLPTLVQYVPQGSFTGKNITLPPIREVKAP